MLPLGKLKFGKKRSNLPGIETNSSEDTSARVAEEKEDGDEEIESTEYNGVETYSSWYICFGRFRRVKSHLSMVC
jgi:hypothetical protein